MLPFIVYGSSALLALLLLAIFRARRWYWHVLSVLAAFGIGLTPIPPRYNTNEVTLAIGFVFTFLFLWGAAAPFFGPKRT
jgi:hypothetical protein